ncbi:YagK/YfjJ domain-containing protein [Pseudomonas laurylsulfatiphila]|uniref:YagK/YfjJ domain-containing protein n=1 Tax=Pseudomonas laurylsulfatiphila TaxID=2011015 RepID=UPI003D248CE0
MIGDDERFIALVSKGRRQVQGVGDVGAVDVGLVCILRDASFLVQKLIKSEGDAFGVKDVAGGLACVTCNSAGTLLKKLVKVHIPDDPQFKALYRFEPYVEMAIECCQEFNLYRIFSYPDMEASLDVATALVMHLNECVDRMRRDVKSKRFLSRLNSYQRSSNKNYKELAEYVEALFERYSRLLVLRIDLSYSKENSKTTQAEATQDRERLFENARSNKMFDDMVGYIWKLEHGREKGFHYHVMLFFDGSKVREDITKAIQIGRYWTNVVTKGRGLYYNCNAAKRLYKSCGIGMVDHADVQMRQGLHKAVVYLTKTDLFMKLQTEGRGMGKMNRPSPKDPRGRPRTACSSGE